MPDHYNAHLIRDAFWLSERVQSTLTLVNMKHE